jgi:hypothetical protein
MGVYPGTQLDSMGTFLFWVGFNNRNTDVSRADNTQLYRWLAWTCDAIDFFSVSLSVTNLQAQFSKTANDITTAITLTLLFRSVGAVGVPIQVVLHSEFHLKV